MASVLNQKLLFNTNTPYNLSTDSTGRLLCHAENTD